MLFNSSIDANTCSEFIKRFMFLLLVCSLCCADADFDADKQRAIECTIQTEMRYGDMLKVMLIEPFPILTSSSRSNGHFQDGKSLWRMV